MRLNQVAAQLYTLREFTKTAADLAATAAKLRAQGWQAVQVSAVGPIPEEEIVRICSGEGLTICATHESSQVIREAPAKIVERLHKLGCSHTAYPHPGGVNLTDPASVHALCRDLDAAGEVLAAGGCTLSYHNHAHEFTRCGDRTVLETIYARTRPAFVQAELDTYWVQAGGADPVAWCRRMAGRMPLIHLKDYKVDAQGKPTMAEIGNGNLDFRAIVQAAEASGCTWFIVEQDTCPGNPFDSLAQSFDYVRTHLVTA